MQRNLTNPPTNGIASAKVKTAVPMMEESHTFIFGKMILAADEPTNGTAKINIGNISNVINPASGSPINVTQIMIKAIGKAQMEINPVSGIATGFLSNI